MCGIVGIAGDLNISLKDGFKDLLLINQVRGRDSTGVFTISSHNEVKHVKMLGTPEVLMDMKSFDTVMSGLPKLIVGHCRHKTVGENTRENAHPYEFDNVIGVHNGSLKSYYQMDGRDHKRTDSHTLYFNIDKYGIEETFEKLDPSGAWALVMWDKVNNRVSFVRNDDRPMWFAWTKDRRAMIFASEVGMFWAISRRTELWDGRDEKDPENPEKRRSPYFQLPVDQLWSFSINDYAKKGEPVMTLHPIQEMKAKGKSAVNFQKGSVGGYGNSGGNPYRVPHAWEKGGKDPPDNIHDWEKNAFGFWVKKQKGGEVSNPFQKGADSETLDDNISDIGGPQQKLLLPDHTHTPEESQTTSGTATKSTLSASTTLGSSMETKHSKNSESNIISLPSRKSRTVLSAFKEQLSRGSNSPSAISDDIKEIQKRHNQHEVKRVTLRNVAGMDYIADNKTSQEWTEAVFSKNTKGICSFCKTPIGGLEEVFSIFDNGKKFLCTDCADSDAILKRA